MATSAPDMAPFKNYKAASLEIHSTIFRRLEVSDTLTVILLLIVKNLRRGQVLNQIRWEPRNKALMLKNTIRLELFLIIMDLSQSILISENLDQLFLMGIMMHISSKKTIWKTNTLKK